MANLGDMVVRIVGDSAQFDSSIDRSQQKFTNFAQTLTKMGRGLSMFITAPLVGIGVAAVRSTANMEDLSAAFETMLGSADASQKMLADLTDFAARTPFQLADLAGASKTLLAFGVDAERVMPSIQMLGDVAQGNAQRFGQMTLAFAQIQSTGRLMGQDLLQLINAGFNPLKTISEQTGQSMVDLKKQMEQGAISAEMVAEAFETATSEGGQFFGGMERASRTFNGLVSTLKDNISLLGREFGTMLLPALKDIAESTIELVQKFQGMDTFTKSLILRVSGFAALLGPLALGIAGVTRAVGGLNVAMAFLAANPVVAVVAGLAAIVLGLRAIGKARRDAKLEEIRTDFEGVSAASEVAAEDIQKVVWGMKAASQEGMEAATHARQLAENLNLSVDEVVAIGLGSSEVTGEYREQLELLQQQLTSDKNALTIDELRTEQRQIRTIAAEEQLNVEAAITEEQERQRLAAEGYNEEQIDNIFARRQATREYNNELRITERRLAAGLVDQKEALQRNIDSATTFRTALADIGYTATTGGGVGQESYIAAGEAIKKAEEELAGYDDTIEIVKQSTITVKELEKRLHTQRMGDIEAEKQAQRDLAMENLAIAETMFDQLSGIYDQLYQNRSIAIDNAYQAEREAIENSVADEEEKAARLEELDEETAKKRRALGRKEAISSKLFALFDIPIKTAMSIMTFLSKGRPLLAAAAAALGAAQFALVAAQPLPALAQGGIIMPSVGGTVAQVAEAGQPEVIFPLDRLEQFLSSRAVPQPGGGAMSEGNIHLTVNMDSQPILDKIFPATRNRQILIDARAVV